MTKWQNAIGTAVMFLIGLGVVWTMVRLIGLSWNRALLVEILWLTVMNRWHQSDRKTSNG